MGRIEIRLAGDFLKEAEVKLGNRFGKVTDIARDLDDLSVRMSLLGALGGGLSAGTLGYNMDVEKQREREKEMGFKKGDRFYWDPSDQTRKIVNALGMGTAGALGGGLLGSVIGLEGMRKIRSKAYKLEDEAYDAADEARRARRSAKWDSAKHKVDSDFWQDEAKWQRRRADSASSEASREKARAHTAEEDANFWEAEYTEQRKRAQEAEDEVSGWKWDHWKSKSKGRNTQEDAKRYKAQEDARRKAQEEARKRQEEARKRHAQEDARRKAQEDARDAKYRAWKEKNKSSRTGAGGRAGTGGIPYGMHNAPDWLQDIYKATGGSKSALKKKRKEMMGKAHPDKGGTTRGAQDINEAFQKYENFFKKAYLMRLVNRTMMHRR